MIHSKKEFFGGVIMIAVFMAVLIVIFMPIFGKISKLHVRCLQH